MLYSLQEFRERDQLSFPIGNLPTLLSTFIGREREAIEVRKLLSIHRLVTLTGAGGSGKTRLSIKLANELLDEFEQGIWFVQFAPLADETLLSHAVASLCVYNSETTPPDNLECRAEEKMRCLRVQLVT